jgi:AbrB family looped-hinge helix DNA binding protein
MRTTISSKGQVVLPVEFRQQDHIAPGEQFEIERIKEGEYLLKKIKPPNKSVFEWLRACPEKDWFERIPSESTDTL